MKISAEKNRYHGDTGWKSDVNLFAKGVVTWKQWLGHSGQHLYAAEILLPHVLNQQAQIEKLMAAKVQSESARLEPSVAGIYFFHCALSVENALKGLIASRPELKMEQEVSTTEKIPKILLSHDLKNLAGCAGLQTHIDDEYVFAFLTRYGSWGGKYALPMKNRDNALTVKLSDGKDYLVGGYRPDTVASFLTFANNVYLKARADIECSQKGETSALHEEYDGTRPTKVRPRYFSSRQS